MTASMLGDPAFAQTFAATWINNWNNRDVGAVLAHFTEDCAFESPLAASVVGDPVIRGKAALETYWRAALERVGTLDFELENAVWDPAQRTLVVFYVSRKDGRDTRACEAMIFNEAGRQTAGRAYYGYALGAK